MRLGLVIAASLALMLGAPDARAQTYTLADAAEAVATSDLAALQYVAADQALLDQLQATDPESLIEFHLAMAQAYEDAGLEDEALEAYQAALVAISRIRGRGHLSMADPMIAVARLTDDPAVRATWFENAYRIRRNHLGRAHPTLSPYLDELNAARAEAGLEASAKRGSACAASRTSIWSMSTGPPTAPPPARPPPPRCSAAGLIASASAWPRSACPATVRRAPSRAPPSGRWSSAPIRTATWS
ncbi:hypothetical protein [Brevundimonas abyssalis]|uniref:Tetratricopeptide repeat protein n=1 Tax=Brevundimonas abyssalis TAR-001 TaxID=1391729 RepID=A0A8E0TSP4_9CAUL|nr:hypothetical protein [Brevundimonas abyssalis]GAD60489.1 hypothetical protein MBEBAB_2739 [Brevundimonas abyssalis TAR-001]